jgi:hypothetical protein
MVYTNLIREGSRNIRFLIVKNIDFYSKRNEANGRAFSFKEFKTKEGNSLPNFDRIPEVILNSNNEGKIFVKKITRDSIIFDTNRDQVEDGIFDLWIFPQ